MEQTLKIETNLGHGIIKLQQISDVISFYLDLLRFVATRGSVRRNTIHLREVMRTRKRAQWGAPRSQDARSWASVYTPSVFVGLRQSVARNVYV